MFVQEYPIAVQRFEDCDPGKRERSAREKIFSIADFDFQIELRLGAGAFVCGEETALMTSIEGNRGEPRPRPPFPALKSLFQKPTILNNVGDVCQYPSLNYCELTEWFASMGTEKSKGTKVFALGGKIHNTGLVEIPMGTTLRESRRSAEECQTGKKLKLLRRKARQEDVSLQNI